MNTKEKLNQFLNNNEIRELWLNRKDFKPTNYDDIIRLFKLNFGRFDYIYGMENIKNNKPTHYSNPYFCGVIDTKNNDLYILSYNINQIDTDIKFISKKMQFTIIEVMQKTISIMGKQTNTHTISIYTKEIQMNC